MTQVSLRSHPVRRFFAAALLAANVLLAAAPVVARPLAEPGTTPPAPVASARLLGADTGAVVLETSFSADGVWAQVDAAGAGSCVDLRLPGVTATEEPGRPRLPVQVVIVGVPPGVEISLETQSLSSTELVDLGVICADAGQNMAAEPSIGVEPAYPAETVKLVELGMARSQRLVRLEVMPVQLYGRGGNVIVHERLRVALRFSGRADTAGVVAESAAFEAAMAGIMLNYEAARGWRALTAISPGEATVWTPPQPGYRVLVREAGLTALTRGVLAGAGVPVDTLDPRTFKLYFAGQQAAIRVSGEEDGQFNEGDAILFYGQGANTRYTDTNIYWLSFGGAAGKRMATAASLGSGATVTSYRNTLRQETNLFYVSSLPKATGHDHWYGQQITAAGFGTPGRRDLSFATAQLDPGNHVARVRALLAGNVSGVHHLRLYVNGQLVHDTSWSQRTLKLAEAEFPQSYLTEGASTIRVELVNDTTGQAIDQAYVDWVEVVYQRQQAAINDALAFGGDSSGMQQYEVSGFTNNTVEVYDIADQANVQRVTGGSVFAAGAGYKLRFAVNQTQPRRFVALTTGRRLAPVAVVADQASDLQNAGNGADYVIVSHASFLAALQPLVDLRAGQGMRVKLVDVQDVYDEFNYGAMSAEAIRDFLAYTYANWPAPAPRDVLLVGDGTYDFRHYLPTSAPTYLPPYLAMVDLEAGETASDNRFAAVSGTDILPDLNVGRLPANTPGETTVMVNKILAYESVSPDEAWTQRVLFVTDNLEGGGGNFYKLSDAIADGFAGPPNQGKLLLPSAYERPKIYLGQTCPTENPSVACRNQLKSELETNGALMVSYIGHGARTFWAVERLLDIVGIIGLQNVGRLPIMLPMTCDEGYFIEPRAGVQSTSEAGIRQPERGSIASYAPTGFGLSTGHEYLERGLFQAVFHDRTAALGAATTASKYYLIANAPPNKYLDLIDTFLLMGDPALQIPLQKADQSQLFMPLQNRSH